MPIAEVLASYRKLGSRKLIATSDFRPEVEIWLFCACATKMCTITLIYGRIADVLLEMYDYVNSAVIVDLTMGQIPFLQNVSLVVEIFVLFA